MIDTPHPGGSGRIGTKTVARVGYGAMQLDESVSPDGAAALLRRAVELGVNHIDTASFYAGGEVNRRIRQALAPYADDLVIVSKVGARYTGEQPIPLAAAQKTAELRAAVEDDLRQLGLDRIPVVNLRRLDLGPGLQAEGDQVVDLDDQLAEMIALRDEGKIGAIGVSNVALEVLQRALPAGIVCVQNAYSVLDRRRSHARLLCGRGHRVGAVLPARIGLHRLPQRRRQHRGTCGRRRARRHTGPGRAGLAAGPRVEHLVDSGHPVDCAPRRERRRGQRRRECGSSRATRRRQRARGWPATPRHRALPARQVASLPWAATKRSSRRGG